MYRTFVLALVLGLSISACDSYEAVPTTSEHDHASAASADVLSKNDASGLQNDKVVALVESINSRLAASGSEVRVDYPWLFRIGVGTDPYARLRTGSRWPWMDPTYLFDESDYTADVPASDVDNALVNAYDSWNDIARSVLYASRVADGGDNYDVLDFPWYDNGNCIDIVDTLAVTLNGYDPSTGFFSISPEADIVVGGWLPPTYFADCLGAANIIGVTWSFSIPDTDGDNYRDRLYVEQYYNEGFAWTIDAAEYLNPGAPIDIETVAVHENGHAHGLGHFGGPVRNQPFTLKPNGRVFNPTAVMNPGYLGGESRDLYPTDEAGMSTMYSRKGGN